jgi:hypothetical protein
LSFWQCLHGCKDKQKTPASGRFFSGK